MSPALRRPHLPEVLPPADVERLCRLAALACGTASARVTIHGEGGFWVDGRWHTDEPQVPGHAPLIAERDVSRLSTIGMPVVIRVHGDAPGGLSAEQAAAFDDVAELAASLIEARLASGGALLRPTMLDRMADGFVMLDGEWRYLQVNLQASALLGRPREQLLGASIWQQFPEAVESSFFDAFHRALREQQPVRVEDYFAPWDRWFEVRLYPSGEGLMVFFTDTTALRRAHEAVRQSEARLRLAAEASGTGVWDWNLLTNEVYYSPEWKRQLGYEDHELPSTFAEFERRLHPDDHARVMANAQRYVAAPEGDYETEFRLCHRDGSYRWIFVRGAVHYDESGRAIRMLGSHVDLTDRKETELELARSRAALHRLSGDLLRTRERERGEVAREIHDELGQALTALKLDVAWLQRHSDGARAALSEKLDTMSVALDRTVQAVRRIAADLRPRMLDDLGLGAALEWQAENFQSRTEVPCRADIRLPHHPSSDVAIALFRIAQESLTNVARHAAASQVVLRLAHEDAQWHLTIADAGCGMVMPQPAGLTTGLNGMQERAHLLGGRLTIESAPGQGTTIHVRVPDGGPAHASPRETHE